MDDILDDKKAVLQTHFFECKICDYNTTEHSKFDRHILTAKHKRMTQGLHLGKEKAETDKKFACVCGSSYKYRQGLWKHQQKCNLEDDTKMVCDKELIMTLIKQNAELLEIIKNGTNSHNNNNNNNTNSHNKTFNLQFFLNETCKNAMNISEFIENISLQLSDLENIGKLGYVEGGMDVVERNKEKIIRKVAKEVMIENEKEHSPNIPE